MDTANQTALKANALMEILNTDYVAVNNFHCTTPVKYCLCAFAFLVFAVPLTQVGVGNFFTWTFYGNVAWLSNVIRDSTVLMSSDELTDYVHRDALELSINNILKGVVSTKYTIVYGQKGAGKSALIDYAIHNKKGVVKLVVIAYQTNNNNCTRSLAFLYRSTQL